MGKQLTYEQIVTIAVREGMKAAEKKFEMLMQKEQRNNKDARLHNTKLLLRNYRAFKAHSEKAVYDAAESDESAFDVLALMTDRDFRNAESTVEAIKNSAIRTAIMVRHINAMLDTLKLICERSGKEEQMRRFRVLSMLYIDDDAKTAEEVAEIECIDRRTVYKDVDSITDTFAALLFGLDAINDK